MNHGGSLADTEPCARGCDGRAGLGCHSRSLEGSPVSEGRASGAGVRDRSPCPPLTGREALASSSGPLGDRAAPVARVGAAAGHRG